MQRALADFRWKSLSGLLLLLLLLGGCVTRIQEPLSPAPPPAETQAAEAARLDWLDAHPDWSFSGRVVLRQHGNGGSGRMEWHQHGTGYRIRLSAPVTRQSWQLEGDLVSGHGRMDGIDGGALDSADAQRLLQELTGWDIPLRLLPDWVRGIPHAAAIPDADARPQQMQQSGWRITWQAWHPPAATFPALPKRIQAVYEGGTDAPRIRLVIDRWEFP